MTGRMRLSREAINHYGGFVLAGLSALGVDLAVLAALGWLGVPPLAGRFVSIACAMVVSWAINRRVTFAVAAPPTWREFAAFAGVSWFAQAVNYAVFAAILVLRPVTEPALAVIAACVVSMFIAYAGFRFGVFRGGQPQPPPGGRRDV